MADNIIIDTSLPFPEPAALPDPEEIDIEAVHDSFAREEIDLICVLGPTASGKTSYAVKLAGLLDRISANRSATAEGEKPIGRAEILSADSRQVYRGMDIGTGKDLSEYGDVPYHLIDIADAGTKYNLYEYQHAFEQAWNDVRSRGGIPILCGGSGLYVEAATSGYALPSVPPDMDLRAKLEAEDIEELREKYAELREITNPDVFKSKRRLIRAIEVALYENSHGAERNRPLPKNVYYIGTLVSREERNRRIDARLDARLEEGMVEEVKGLLDKGIPAEDLVYYGLEYKFVTQYVLGILSLDEMKILLANAIHQFAKRQMTWFRGMERKGIRIHWVMPDSI